MYAERCCSFDRTRIGSVDYIGVLIETFHGSQLISWARAWPRSRWEKKPKFRIEDGGLGKEKALAVESRQGW